ncbi:MAG: DUF4091 domain-containing protein [Victivallaceae bacterium]|nr:DUF4091 domain-containing protein [Victivallaceae bacterium]
MFFQTRFVSSLEKVFCKRELAAERIESVSGAKGETVAFQLACKAEDNYPLEWEVESPFGNALSIREVGLVPCALPAVPEDPYVLTAEPGIFPDPLLEMKRRQIRLSRGNWHALWCSVRIPEEMEPGEYQISFRAFSPPDFQHLPKFNQDYKLTFCVKVLPFVLPEQKLLFINWFYADCISEYYRIPCWSQRHWELLERYFLNAFAHGVNVLYTPLWSVPLDTAIGQERPTVQLLNISCEKNRYTFDFKWLARWIETAQKAGFHCFEMSHAFTQWGAHATPKIIVRENGVEHKKFGWHVAADAPEYRDFLTQLTAALLPFFKERGLTPENTFFHVSDEPEMQDIQSYRSASELLRGLIGDYPVIDALSSVDFYRAGLIQRPIPITLKIEEFMKEDLEQRWVYYCGNWQNCAPNRSFGMPSTRNRIMGILLYLYNLDGFLHWGYNFWFTEDSKELHINPYYETDAGHAFCGGNSYMVYPGDDGPIDSLHYEVFAEGLQDLRALRLLESLIGRDKTVALIQQDTDKITMFHYPLESEWLLSVRERINQAIVNFKRV